MRTTAACLCAVALVGSGMARGAVDGSASLGMWIEEDTNPRRLPEEPVDEDDAPVPVAADGLLRVAALYGLGLRHGALSTHVDGAVGGKLFFTAATERMLVGWTRARLVLRIDDDTTLLASTSAKLRGQVSGARSYGNVRSDLSLERTLAGDLAARGTVAGTAFSAFDEPLFSHGGGAVGGALVWRVDRERVEAFVEAALRGYPFATKTPGSRDPDRRIDDVLVGGVHLVSARRLSLQGGALVVRNDSNARGEAFVRLRAHLAAGTRLPARVTATGQIAVQLTRYDDGVSLGQRYFLAADDETQNLVEFTLSRPLWGGLAIDGRVGFFGNELARDGARFSRTTAAIGLRADLL